MQFEWDERKSRVNIEKHGLALQIPSESLIVHYSSLIRLDELKDYGNLVGSRWVIWMKQLSS